MSRRGWQKDDHYEANVWPAVTDSILLMASIFIVLSVVTMLTLANKLHDYEQQKAGHEGTLCTTYAIDEKFLFDLGKSELVNPTASNALLKGVLTDMGKSRPEIIRKAKEEWGDRFYIVLEVAGHADDTGPASVNWNLSTARAATVIMAIQGILKGDRDIRDALQVDDDALAQNGKTILRAAGYSYHVPYIPVVGLSKDQKKEARKRNRRVEIRLFAQPVELVHRREVKGE